MKNILITGANGQLGNEFRNVLPYALFTGHNDLDITDAKAVNKFVKSHDIGTVVNCAAFTATEQAEDNYDAAYDVNVLGPKNLAKTGCKIIHISTDYVFDGRASLPYTPMSIPNPLSVYGATKLGGEKALLANAKNCIVIRASWLYSVYGKNFVKTMRNLGANKQEISVVNDQYGLPTYATDLACAIAQIIPQMKKDNSGVYHFSNIGIGAEKLDGITWYDFAVEIMKLSNLNCVVRPVDSAQYPTRVRRPKYSVMDTSKIQNVFGIKIPTWKDALGRCIKNLER